MARDAHGRWVKGTSGNPGGRPSGVKYLEAIEAGVSMDDWLLVVQTALADAIAGDARARQWLAVRLMGKPRERVQVDAVVAGMTVAQWKDRAEQRLEDANG